jgi:hypothetical protein
MTTPLNRVNSDPSMKDLLDLFKKEIFLSLNCHTLATIQSFDPVTQLVSATINYKKAILRADPLTGVYSQVLVDFPVMIDCPVIILQGGGASLQLPIANGDTCLILFNDRDIDNWLQSGQVGPLATQRLHSFADGIALIGIRSVNNAFTDFDTTRAVLKGPGYTSIGLSATKIRIKNNVQNLNDLLQTLITEIKSLVTATAAITVTGVTPGLGVSGVPANAAVITAIGTQLTTTATQIGELLE